MTIAVQASPPYVFLKQNATSPVIPFAFTQGPPGALGTAAPVDLTGKTVRFWMRPWNTPLGEGATYTVNGDLATIDNAADGTGHYTLSAPDTAAPGHYLAEWQADPGALRLPVDGYLHVLISPSL